MVVTIGLAQLFGGIQLLVPGWLNGPSIVGGVDTPLSSHHVLIFPVALHRQRPADRHRRPGRARGARLVPAAHRRRGRRALGGGQLGPGPAPRHSGAPALHAGLGDRRPAGRPDGHPQRAVRRASPSRPGRVPTLILPALAAAIIAGMESLPVAFGAGVALGVDQRARSSSTCRASGARSATCVNLVAILGGLLFLQRKRSRADDAEESFSVDGHPQADPRRAAFAARGQGGPRRGHGAGRRS